MKQYNKYYQGNEPLTSTDTISVNIKYYRILKMKFCRNHKNYFLQMNQIKEAPVLI